MSPPPAGSRKRSSAASRATPSRDPDLQPEPADVAADPLHRGRLREFREALDASEIESATIHAVYLINCASKEREIRSKSIASLTHALRVGDGIGAARRRPARRGAQGRAAPAVDEAGGEGDRQGARPTPMRARCCSRTRPAPRARWAQLRRARRAGRAARRRRAGRDLPRLVPSARLRVRDPHGRGARERWSTSSTPRSGSIACAACTSTTRRPRWAATAIATPTSARARSASAASASSSPSRASTSCRP